MGISVEDCVAWYEAGGRRWHSSVDVPGDIERVEREIGMESVVGMDRAMREIRVSGLSEYTKEVCEKVFGACIEAELECLN